MSTLSVSVAPLTKVEVQTLATNWYRKLDVHAPLVELLPMLSEQNLEMRFPEATLHGFAEFEAWYEGVIRIFFDEVHSLKQVDVDLVGDEAQVKVVVHWEASTWKAPAAASNRIKLNAFQTWTVRRSPEHGRPVIAVYTVDRLEYEPDSARL